MKYIFTFIFLIFIGQIIAQTTKIDSLINVVENSLGEPKVEALSQLSKLMCNQNQNKGIEYGEQALDIINKEKLPELEAGILNNIGLNYWVKTEYSVARKYFEQAHQLSEQYKDSAEIAISYNRMGLIYEMTNDYDSAIIVFIKGLEIEKKIKSYRIGISQENIGTIHYHRGEFNSALKYFLEAKNTFEINNKIEDLVRIKYKIGIIYSETKDYQEAEKYYKEAIEYYKKKNNPEQLARIIIAFGVNYKAQELYIEALQQYNEALEVIKGIDLKPIEMFIYNNIGSVYFEMENYKESLTYHKKSLEIALLISHPNQIATTYFNIGNIYNMLENYSLASEYIEKAEVIYDSLQVSNNLLTTYNKLIEVNNNLGNYKKSVKYYGLLTALNDSINKTQLNSSLDSMKVQFKTEQIENENTILTQQTKLKNKTIANQKNIIFAIIIIVSLVLILMIFILINRKRLKHANTKLLQSNEEISQQAEELQLLNNKLVELDNFKAGLMQMLVHDLKNPINNLFNIHHFSSHSEQIKTVKYISQTMLNLVQDILDVNKYENTKMKLLLAPISAIEIINIAQQDVKILLENKNIKIKKNISPQIGIKCDKEIIIRVFTNLLTNAIKYSPTNSKIIISNSEYDINDDFTQFKIIDQGEGISAKNSERIFDKFVQANVKKGEKIRSTGLGLTFCKLAVESHGGNIKAESDTDKGAVFTFTLPKTNQIKKEQNIITQKNKPKYIFSEEEIKYLSLYYDELNRTPVYKISTINSILENIKTDTDSPKIMKWCDELDQISLNGNQEQYIEFLSFLKKRNY